MNFFVAFFNDTIFIATSYIKYLQFYWNFLGVHESYSLSSFPYHWFPYQASEEIDAVEGVALAMRKVGARAAS